jgi:hypothetical protein
MTMAIVLDGALLLGVLLVVPLGAAIHPHLRSRGIRWMALVTGLVAALGILDGPGGRAAALVLPLGAWTVVAGVRSVHAWWRRRSLEALVHPVAIGYLGVGVAWLLADLMELEPAGFAPPLVALTAIHFTYAGFAALLIASRTRGHAGTTLARTTAVGLVATAAGPPLVATGFAMLGLLQVIGAVVLTLGLYLIAAALLVTVVPRAPRLAGSLLAVAAIAVVVPMLLAVHWAAGTTFGFSTLSIPAMARTHGVVNALGFVLPALVGLRLLDGRAQSLGAAARRS